MEWTVVERLVEWTVVEAVGEACGSRATNIGMVDLAAFGTVLNQYIYSINTASSKLMHIFLEWNSFGLQTLF